jgi:hypothetical protein
MLELVLKLLWRTVMKIYKVEFDQGIDDQWTVGYYSTLDKAIAKCKDTILEEKQIIVEEDKIAVEVEEVVLDDYTGPMVYGLNCKVCGRWSFGTYVYQIEVDDNE